jgi:hypothetical protein
MLSTALKGPVIVKNFENNEDEEEDEDDDEESEFYPEYINEYLKSEMLLSRVSTIIEIVSDEAALETFLNDQPEIGFACDFNIEALIQVAKNDIETVIQIDEKNHKAYALKVKCEQILKEYSLATGTNMKSISKDDNLNSSDLFHDAMKGES